MENNGQIDTDDGEFSVKLDVIVDDYDVCSFGIKISHDFGIQKQDSQGIKCLSPSKVQQQARIELKNDLHNKINKK